MSAPPLLLTVADLPAFCWWWWCCSCRLSCAAQAFLAAQAPPDSTTTNNNSSQPSAAVSAKPPGGAVGASKGAQPDPASSSSPPRPLTRAEFLGALVRLSRGINLPPSSSYFNNNNNNQDGASLEGAASWGRQLGGSTDTAAARDDCLPSAPLVACLLLTDWASSLLLPPVCVCRGRL